MANLTALQAMNAMEAAAGVLKRRFNNLNAVEIATLAKAIVKAIVETPDEEAANG